MLLKHRLTAAGGQKPHNSEVHLCKAQTQESVSSQTMVLDSVAYQLLLADLTSNWTGREEETEEVIVILAAAKGASLDVAVGAVLKETDATFTR